MADNNEYIQNSIPNYIDFDYGRDYLNARNRFQKGYTAISGEPGFFYFRVFFDWNSPLLAWNSSNTLVSITAQNFLNNNRHRCNCDKRYKALLKFRKLLYFMAKDTPWAFRKISGTGEGTFTDMATPGKGNKTLKLDFSEEFTDFRVTLLLDLYRYICYDQVQQRIILPENLTRFNMSVMYFGVPLRWFHTPITSTSIGSSLKTAGAELLSSVGLGNAIKNDNPGYARLNKGALHINRDAGIISSGKDDYFKETISVHILHFINCRISPKSTYNTFDNGNAQSPFQITPSIEITYDRAFTQDISEWFELQISENVNDYFDTQAIDIPRTEAEKAEITSKNNKSRLKNILANISKTLLNSIVGATDFHSSSGLTKRRKAIREQKLYGGTTIMSVLNGIAENALNTVTGSVMDKLYLGNIYNDNSCMSIVQGALSAQNGQEMMNNVITSGLSMAANKTGNQALGIFANGGISGAAASIARATGQWAAGGGTQAYNDLFMSGKSQTRPITLWESGPTKESSKTLNIIKQEPNIFS